MMSILEFLTDSFVAAFGITEPQPGQRRKVVLLLGGSILAGALGAVGIVVFFLLQLHGG